MPSKPVKTTHWSPTRTPKEQAVIDAIKAGAIRRAIPRDALTGRPLDANAQTMTGWYLPPLPSGAGSNAGGHEPTRYCHLPRAVTRVSAWDATHPGALRATAVPETPTDEETEADAGSDTGSGERDA